MRRTLSLVPLLLAGALTTAAQPPASPARRARADVSSPHELLARLEQALDRAVRHVSRPTAVHALGISAACRGYYLAGYGAVFVLPPQGLPGERPTVVVRRLPQRRPAPRSSPAAEGGALPAPAPGSELDLFLDPELRPLLEGQDAQVRRMERQLLEFQHQVEAFQRDAELAREAADRNLQQMAQQVRIRLGSVPEGALEWVVLQPPDAVAPVAAVPAAPAAPPAPGAPAAAPAAPVTAPAPVAPPAPPAPPWRFWFRGDEDVDPRTPERVVTDVRQAIVEALEAHGHLLAVVPPQELVTVAVDFTTPLFALGAERPRPERTLVLRVRKKDLEERAAGRLASDELRRRVEVLEY
ncbi:MAG: hypothetical protein AB7O37_03070 [Vicinamibacteria bacterium]